MTALVAGARAGRLVSFPTDTVPALAVRPDQGNAIYAIKQRAADKPLILMAATLDHLWAYIDRQNPHFAHWVATAQINFPGAITLVLPANELGRSLNHGIDTLGVRIPDHPIAQCILQQTGPLLTTSVNHSGLPPLREMISIATEFPAVLTWGDGIDIYAATGSGQPSTVVAWRNQNWQVCRQGTLHLKKLDLCC
ncbi:MAG: L-threonylcarbamoyladenylate synthase [Pseudanabaena sp. ELA607]